MIARDYNEADEQEAYAVGAAALVPFTALHRYVEQGKTVADIARHFRVSRKLVQFRLQVSKLWPEYKARHPEDHAGRAAARAASSASPVPARQPSEP
jgi:Zn-dependent peptidase ImmA (M78 family)